MDENKSNLRKYRVVKITNNIEGYPECAINTEEFPDLVCKVEDEMDIFVVAESGNYWKAEDFFHMVPFNEFYANK